MYNVNLVLTSELAADYFSLRELDAEYQVVQDSVDIQQRGLQLVEYRHDGGVASGSRSGATADIAQLDANAALPGAATTRPIRTRHRRADRKPGRDVQCSGSLADGKRRFQFRSVCRRICWSGVLMLPSPSGRWRSRTLLSASRKRRFIRS